MNTSLEDAWREVSPYLDTVLDLTPGARQRWLAGFAKREPALAAHIRIFLLELEALEAEDFLGTPALLDRAGVFVVFSCAVPM